ncbi:MAG: hypothetical protein NT009_14735 [Proteobacteria bacterium]|nr:hypothetical protein [Pseudomonadota bacterium]
MKNCFRGKDYRKASRRPECRRRGFVRFGLAAILLMTLTGGCMMAGNYHSAKTLGKGESSFGMTFGINRMSNDNDHVIVPNVIPEFAFHVGLAKNWEIGGRVAPGALGIELDTKYRFLQKGDLHLAVVPAVAYQALFEGYGLTFRLPVVLSYDFIDNFGFNAAVFGGLSAYESDEGDDEEFFQYIEGEILSYGVSLGPELRGSVFFVRPEVEFVRYESSLKHADNLNGESWEPVNSVNVLVHFGWIFGREKQQLERVEEKLDKALEKNVNPEQK